MRREDIKIGQKVVPHSKSKGNPFDSSCWKKENKYPYLYVIRIDGNTIVLDDERDAELGDYFLPEDLDPYIEDNKTNKNESGSVKMKKSELNSSMLFKMKDGDLCALLSDSEGNMILNNRKDIKQGYSDYEISLNDYDEDLSPEDEAYDIVAIKQLDTCVKVIADVLGEQEPEEWDWVEEVEKDVESEVENVVQNITINIAIDSSNKDSSQFRELINNLSKYATQYSKV